MALENTQIQDKLTATFGESVVNFRQEKDIFTFEVTADEMTSVILFLKNEESLNFHFFNRFMRYSLSR
ncbi:NADH dehydrogenase subunit C [Flavobacterium psychrophilum]|nr:NADH dehydrogenase subunit C [Flavobacterium psychrophilum]